MFEFSMKFVTIFILILYNIDIATAQQRPQGPQGPQRPQGPQGPQRPQGPQAPPQHTIRTTSTPVPDPLRNIYYDYYSVIEWCMNRSAQFTAAHEDWVIDTYNFGGTPNGYNLTGFFIQFKKDQKIIFFEANIHGGEPLASGVAVYVFNELVTSNASSNIDDRSIIESYNWMVVPVANPDGYMYKRSDPFMFRKQSWKKSVTNETDEPNKPPVPQEELQARSALISNRKLTHLENNKMRKKRFCVLGFIFWCETTTRRTTTPTTPPRTTTLPKRPCMGINPNLNFKYKFGTMGVITDVCEQNYPGLEAEKEPVTKYLAQYITENNKDIIMYISLHTNETRRIMVPFSNGEYCSNFNVLKDISQKTSDLVRKKMRAKYNVGNIGDAKEISSGHSVDFARDMGIKYTFMVETQDNKWQNAPPSMVASRGKEVMLVTLQLCRGAIREENRAPGQIQKVTKPPPPPSRQNRLHPDSIVIVSIVLCLTVYQIYNPMLFS